MREGFQAISSGWTLYSGMENLTERIEHLAKWTKENGPLEPDEATTVQLMIKCQIARGMFPYLEEYEPRDDDEDEYDFDDLHPLRPW